MLKLLSFDIDDTIAESKQPIHPDMAKLLAILSQYYYLHFVTGGALSLILQNTINPIISYNANINNIFISPNVGALLVHLQEEASKHKYSYKIIYENPISKAEFDRIKTIFEKVLPLVKHNPKRTYGPLIEYRKYSITFSALGQDAPLEVKSKYDPTKEKRKEIVNLLHEIGPEYQIGIAGKSSIDITKKGINKGFALTKVVEYLGLSKQNALFFGDALMPGGNDYAVKQAGFKTLQVSNWQETFNYLSNLLQNQTG